MADSAELVLPLSAADDDRLAWAGGKGRALAALVAQGERVPPGACILAEAYRRFVEENRIDGKIRMELGRKAFADMRWEEIWDASLRIRNVFVSRPLGDDLEDLLLPPLFALLGEGALVLRSSALDEDGQARSFAGLHESVVGVRGRDAVSLGIRRVWASLWSDAALLYRRELGLDPRRSAMAVVAQPLVRGRCAGVTFSEDPADGEKIRIEAVWGLGQGLVDGTVAPDAWLLGRRGGPLRHLPPGEDRACLVPVGPSGEPVLRSLAEAGFPCRPPLEARELERLRGLALRLEGRQGKAVDLEWTVDGRRIWLLQVRPITTSGRGEPDGRAEGDRRPWYLSLHRSQANLESLARKIEDEVLPGMDRAAARMAAERLEELDDLSLADALESREKEKRRWVDAYWEDCIPFAHGARLFGQVYNDLMGPEDPHSFVDLLRDPDMESLERNRMLEGLAAMIREDAALRRRLEEDGGDVPPGPFSDALDSLLRHAERGSKDLALFADRGLVARLALRIARRRVDGPEQGEAERAARVEAFLSAGGDAMRPRLERLLDLARASYRLRDDDNLHLGRVDAQVERCRRICRDRLAIRFGREGCVGDDALVRALRDREYRPEARREDDPDRTETPSPVRWRQMQGQPAGRGLVTAVARVVGTPEDLFAFREGEILVCDAIEPGMTFVAPLAAGIVERRGGMLIHGAIIAREYGLPCVTGVPEATRRIATGDRITVDGYLGIVTRHVGEEERSVASPRPAR